MRKCEWIALSRRATFFSLPSLVRACSFRPPHTHTTLSLFLSLFPILLFSIYFSPSVTIRVLTCSFTRLFKCLHLFTIVLCVHIYNAFCESANNLETVFQYVDFIGVYCTYFCYDTNSQTLNSVTIDILSRGTQMREQSWIEMTTKLILHTPYI